MRMVVEQLRTMKKPVVSLVRQGLAASAAYGIVASTKEVYASDPQDVFGSIGIYMTTADMYGYYEKEGLVMKDHYATLSTDKNGPFREAIEGKPERLINEIIDPFNAAFIDLIKEARPAMAKTEAKWNTGRTFFGDEALELGLIDGYNTLEGCIARVRALAASTPSTPKNKSTMSWKTNLMNALNKVFGTNEAVTAEAIAAVNTELAANGATEVEVMAVAEATAARAAVAQVADLSAKLEVLTADLAAATTARDEAYAKQGAALTEVTNLTTQLSEAKARIELLENEGGSEGKPANANGGAGDKDPANTEKDPKDYAHNVAVRQILARM
jgi:ClpP class serine protease